jgi:hypothetical protein
VFDPDTRQTRDTLAAQQLSQQGDQFGKQFGLQEQAQRNQQRQFNDQIGFQRQQAVGSVFDPNTRQTRDTLAAQQLEQQGAFQRGQLTGRFDGEATLARDQLDTQNRQFQQNFEQATTFERLGREQQARQFRGQFGEQSRQFDISNQQRENFEKLGRNQQQQQFRASLEQQGSQFDQGFAQNTFQERAQREQQAQQFRDSFRKQGRQFNRSFGLQQDQFDASERDAQLARLFQGAEVVGGGFQERLGDQLSSTFDSFSDAQLNQRLGRSFGFDSQGSGASGQQSSQTVSIAGPNGTIIQIPGRQSGETQGQFAQRVRDKQSKDEAQDLSPVERRWGLT